MKKIKRWIVEDLNSQTDDKIEYLLDNPTLTSIYNKRDIYTKKELDEYKDCEDFDIYSTDAIPNIDIATERILKALENKEQIYIYGDYDVDGMTSTSIMLKCLKYLGAKVDYYIPDRFEEGYGVNEEAIFKISQKKSNLIITVDTGITAVSEIERANELGIDVIITDHHNVGEVLPDAFCIVNPKLSTSEDIDTMLAGVGVAFKLAVHILKKSSISSKKLLDEILILAMVGTIADIVPIKKENRLIVKKGLEIYKRGLNFGIDALIDISRINQESFSSTDIGFGIAPRLNSAGRLSHASIGVELLMCDNYNGAHLIADELNKLNSQRQYKTTQILKNANAQIEEEPRCLSSGIVIVWGDSWHEGVLGIVASKLVDSFFRPAIVLSLKDGILKGSARSIEGFSIYEALKDSSHILNAFGGHDQAAGISLDYDKIDDLISGIKEYSDKNLTEDLLVPKIHLDTILNIKDYNKLFYEEIRNLEPFGAENQEPIFLMENLTLEEARLVGKSQNHLKLTLSSRGRFAQGIFFFYNDSLDLDFSRTQRVDLTSKISLNEYMGNVNLQLQVSDIRFYDPKSSNFAKRAHDIYILKLYDRLRNWHFIQKDENEIINDISKIDIIDRDRYGMSKAIDNGDKIIITSYEGFLEICYLLFDLGYISADFSYDFLEEFDNIILLPETIEKGCMNDFPLVYSYENDFMLSSFYENKFYNSEHDNVYLYTNLLNWRYDRNRFIKLYKKISYEKTLNVYDELLNSATIFDDMIAWLFFEEANFVTIDDNYIKIKDKEHKKIEFENSIIYKKLGIITSTRRIGKWI